jgi:DNA-binding Xre family transcriptional regulator
MNEHINTDHTVLKDESGNPAFVVVPWADYPSLYKTAEITIPHEVVALLVKHDCTLLGAWRRHRQMSQQELSSLTGIPQGSLSRMESQNTTYQEATLEKLSAALSISPEQLIDDE